MVVCILLGYLLLILGGVGGFAMERANAKADLAREQAAVDREQSAACVNRNDNRAQIRVIIATLKDIVSSTGSRPDYSKVPGYDDLDPSFQIFLRNTTSGSAGEEYRQSVLAKLDVAEAAFQPDPC
jgi:hypothetical protein